MNGWEIVKHQETGLIMQGYVHTYFINDDAGKSKSKRSKQENDCTVRSLAIAFDMEYDDAYNYLKEHGRKNGRGFEGKRIPLPISL